MRWIQSALAAIALIAASSTLADTKHVTWVNATKNTDGTNIAASGAGSLVRTTIEYGTCTGTPKAFGTKAGEIFVAAPATATDLPLVVVQEFCLAAFHSNTFATAFAPCLSASSCPVGNSARSAVAITQGGPPTPGVPTSLAVNAGSPIAWTPITTDEALTGLAVGNAREGAACDATQSFTSPFVAGGATLYRVPISDVDLLPSQRRTLVAFTKCSPSNG